MVLSILGAKLGERPSFLESTTPWDSLYYCSLIVDLLFVVTKTTLLKSTEHDLFCITTNCQIRHEHGCRMCKQNHYYHRPFMRTPLSPQKRVDATMMASL
jgi:hypothetical protein